MAKLTERGNYPNAAPKSQKYGSIIVISSVASVHGGCWVSSCRFQTMGNAEKLTFWKGPCYTMTSHAALGVVKAGVATLKGTGVRINCVRILPRLSMCLRSRNYLEMAHPLGLSILTVANSARIDITGTGRQRRRPSRGK